MIVTGDEIPHEELASDLVTEERVQRIVPFLGAGVSISARTSRDDPAPPCQDPRIAKAMACLKEDGQQHRDAEGNARVTLDSATQLYAETALELAFLIQQMRDDAAQRPADDIFDQLRNDEYPPSASELIEFLSRRAKYVSFEEVLSRISKRLRRGIDPAYQDAMLVLLRLIAGLVGASSAPLSSISAFFDAVRGRRTLLDRLAEILENKRIPTPTHHLIARAAKWHLASSRNRRATELGEATGHYLIITTNYDELMEIALEAAAVPYVVITMSLKDFLIRARFANLPAESQRLFEDVNPPRPAKAFTLERPASFSSQRLAIVYKVHGCIREWMKTPPESKTDTIVISDNDYVLNISRFSHNDGVIPACVGDILQRDDKPYFLFLGYSLSDWNIRGMLRAIRTKRAGEGNEDNDYGDFTVVRKFNKLDEAFFLQNKIRIAQQDLKDFSSALNRSIDEHYRN